MPFVMLVFHSSDQFPFNNMEPSSEDEQVSEVSFIEPLFLQLQREAAKREQTTRDGCPGIKRKDPPRPYSVQPLLFQHIQQATCDKRTPHCPRSAWTGHSDRFNRRPSEKGQRTTLHLKG